MAWSPVPTTCFPWPRRRGFKMSRKQAAHTQAAPKKKPPGNKKARRIWTGAGGAALALVFMAVGGPTVRAQALITDISEHLISITSNFTGTSLLLFGAIDSAVAGPGDVVVVIRGPRKRMVVRQKDRVAGIWMNIDSVRFDNVPGFYIAASTRPLEELAGKSLLARHAIGLENLRLRGRKVRRSGQGDGVGDIAPYKEAVLRIMQRRGLFKEAPGEVRFLGDALFRTEIHFPVNVPVGNYTAEVYLIRDGRIVSAQSSPLFIDKSGLERMIHSFAVRKPALYGILAVLAALAAGWAAAVVFRQR